jgi:hypothetical protein
MLKLMKLTICVLLLTLSYACKIQAACIRPQDMSNSKAVDYFMNCKKKIEGLCEKDAHLKYCATIKRPADYNARFPMNTVDIDPQQRCTVYRDGSYKCLQDPVRFIAKQRTNDAPIAVPTPTPDESTDQTAKPAAPQPVIAPGTPSGPLPPNK